MIYDMVKPSGTLKHSEALIKIVHEEARKSIGNIDYLSCHLMADYIAQQEELTTTVKRYFELKAKGITTEAEALEYRELLNKINEMVGIK